MLVVGKDKSPLLSHLPSSFLFIDGGEHLPFITIPKRRKVTYFDPTKHSFNVLKDMTKKKARELSNVFYSRSPQGENTLTVRDGKRALQQLLYEAKRLDRLPCSGSDEDIEAQAVINDTLFSDILPNVLLNPTNFSLKGIVLARLNRGELGDDDCFILGNLLMYLYDGPIVVSDGGFYLRKHHTKLIHQGRLRVGLNYLDESPLKKDLLLIKDKMPSKCSYEDAQTLADHAGIPPNSDGRDTFVKRATGLLSGNPY